MWVPQHAHADAPAHTQATPARLRVGGGKGAAVVVPGVWFLGTCAVPVRPAHQGAASREMAGHLPISNLRRPVLSIKRRRRWGQTPREKKTRHLMSKWIRISFIFESFRPSAVTGVKQRASRGSVAGPEAAVR